MAIREWPAGNNRLLVEELRVVDTDGNHSQNYTHREFLTTRKCVTGNVLESVYGTGYREALALVRGLRREQKSTVIH